MKEMGQRKRNLRRMRTNAGWLAAADDNDDDNGDVFYKTDIDYRRPFIHIHIGILDPCECCKNT